MRREQEQDEQRGANEDEGQRMKDHARRRDHIAIGIASGGGAWIINGTARWVRKAAQRSFACDGG